MVTQPLGDSGVTLKPFVVNGFNDEFYSTLYVSGGLTAEYHPCENLTFGVTAWGAPQYTGDDGAPFFLAESQVTWKLPPHLTLSAEALYGQIHPSGTRLSWSGLSALANYDLTDRWRVFGQWSYLDYPLGSIFDANQRRHALSAGVAYQIIRDMELRGEYRHELSSSLTDTDRVSLDLTFGF